MPTTTLPLVRGSRRNPNTGFVEWEDTPSLSDSLSQRLRWHGSNQHPAPPRLLSLRRLLLDLSPEMLVDAMRAGYAESRRTPLVEIDIDLSARSTHSGDTVRCGLEPAAASAPFCEPLAGLSVREVMDGDVFRHFFGN